MPSVLVIDDQPAVTSFLATLLSGEGYAVTTAGTAHDGLAAAGREAPDAILLDLVLPDGNGLDLLRELRGSLPGTVVIVMTAHGEIDTAVRCMRAGATDFLPKPFHPQQLLLALERALAQHRQQRDLARLRLQQGSLPGAAGFVLSSAPAMQSVYETIRRLGDSDRTTVLIEGESGVGKDVLAHMIHAVSPRSDAPMLELNCAALPENLLESELFGHERGAFTDAHQAKPGLLELASGGTLFLDEIGEMALPLQAKLLSVMEKQTFRRVGGVRDVRVDVRLIAATNRDLRAMVAAGRFREDLYYRLQVVTLQVPPLRERPEDIEPLATHFLTIFNAQFNRAIAGFTAEGLELLRAHSWPGNVRELRNVLERAVLLSDVDRLGPAELRLGDGPSPRTDDPLLLRLQRALAGEWSEGCDLEDLLVDLEIRLIREALARTGGNKSAAARLLGLNRDKLRYRLKEYRIDA